jgi:ribosome-binding factor A
MAGHRAERMSQLILQEISVMLTRELADPRLAGTRVLHVEVTGDLRLAKIYVNATGYTDEELREMLTGLQHASSFMRRQLARSIELRYAPELRFYLDDSIEKGEHFLELLDRVREQDQANEQAKRNRKDE